MTEDDAIRKIEECLMLSPNELNRESKAEEIDAWDSMATFGIVQWLDSEFEIELPPGETSKLSSVEGVLEILRDAGKVT